MKTLEFTFLDRTAWPPGPWDGEQDKIQWRDEATGLPCLIVRNDLGALCGYVGVSEGHPYYQQNYKDIAGDIECHGGLSYSDGRQPGPSEEQEDVWWLGFDCCHFRDDYPLNPIKDGLGSYKDISFVRRECRQLAEQLKGIA